MTDPPRELLVMIDPGLGDQALHRLRAVASVTQVLPPRLALVGADPEATDRVTGVVGVLGVYDDTLPDRPPDLTPAEDVFISAWEARRHPKTRRGEGLPWDAPGFLPPDPPTDRR
jgi:hypothetical protein